MTVWVVLVPLLEVDEVEFDEVEFKVMPVEGGGPN